MKLTDACRSVLRAEERLLLRRETKPEKRTKKVAVRSRAAFTRETDSMLWQALRARRLEIAKAQGVPPYVVFHDATLAAIVDNRPRTLQELSHISGVGERKLAAYGEDFLKVILAHAGEPVMDATTEPLG